MSIKRVPGTALERIPNTWINEECPYIGGHGNGQGIIQIRGRRRADHSGCTRELDEALGHTEMSLKLRELE